VTTFKLSRPVFLAWQHFSAAHCFAFSSHLARRCTIAEGFCLFLAAVSGWLVSLPFLLIGGCARWLEITREAFPKLKLLLGAGPGAFTFVLSAEAALA